MKRLWGFLCLAVWHFTLVAQAGDLPQWSPLKGTFQVGLSSVHGQKGVAAAPNTPGMRLGASIWTGTNGKLYLFGGAGLDANGIQGAMNDLWRYDRSTGFWTWIHGSNLADQPGNWGTMGVAAGTNVPSGRVASAAVVDSSGNVYLHGGYGLGNETLNPDEGALSDFWFYQTASNQWTWLGGGGDLVNEKGVYGTFGVEADTNYPGSRSGACLWVDSSKVFLFGGLGTPESSGIGELNDLWTMNRSNGKWTWVHGSKYVRRSGNYGTKGTANATNTPGGRSNAANWSGTDGRLYLFAGTGIPALSSMFAYDLNDLWRYDPSNNQWTWVHGSKTELEYGVYGTEGVPSDDTVPGARSYAGVCVSGDGGSFIFGGFGRGALSAGVSGYLNDLWKYNSTTNQWTYLKGTDQIDQPGVHGTIGLAAKANRPGGRQSPNLWRASNGQIFFFSGYGIDSAGNYTSQADLWKFNPSDTKWTWLGGPKTTKAAAIYGTRGVSAEANNPGARYEACSWTGNDGAFYLFGGYGRDSVNDEDAINDLWRFNPKTIQWTWLKGSNRCLEHGTYGTRGTAAANNTPGARSRATACGTINGRLYLFGGEGYGESSVASGILNDLWQYNPASGRWMWMNGSKETGQNGVYGTINVEAQTNAPGSRSSAAGCAAPDGKVYIFGGYGRDAAGDEGYLNDLWRFNPGNSRWTWLKGSNTKGAFGTYGIKGVPADANTPGGHYQAVMCASKDGMLYLFGGNGYGKSASGRLNDLWRFNLATGQWTWLSGSDTPDAKGVYGTLGTPAATNSPGARNAHVGGITSDGRFYFSGGYGYDSSGRDSLNDVWLYDPALGQWAWVGGSNIRKAPGILAGINKAPGARSAPTGAPIGTGLLFYLFGGYGQDCGGYTESLNDLWSLSLTDSARVSDAWDEYK